MLKIALYKLIRKLFFPFLGNSQTSIKTKHFWGLHLAEPFYFKRFLSEKNDKYSNRLNPEKSIQDFLAGLIPETTCNKIKILDIGAGPITRVGYKLHGKHIDLYPIDPLAMVYNRMLSKNNIDPPIKTTFGTVEGLRDQFCENKFDLAYANNSIDHTSNPINAIHNIWYVLKPDRYFYFSHFINEGENNNYFGLHQWNFYCVGNNIHLCNRSKNIKYNLTDEFKNEFEISTTVVNRRIVAKFKKIHPCNFHQTQH